VGVPGKGEGVSDEPVEFLASFPPIQSAIKIDGQGGARIQLDVPETEMGKFIKAMMWRGKVIKVTFELENLTELDYGNKKQADQRPEKLTSKVGRRRS
jgi:hypothetical protein